MFVVAGAGGGGIGTAVCRALVESGARVLALDRDALRLEAAANLGERVNARQCDVRDPDAFAGALSEAGEVRGLVHVAGGLRVEQWSATEDVALEVFDEVVALNLRAAVVTSQAVATRLIGQRRGGSIVHIASIAGLAAMPYGAAYAAAKAAMIALARTQAVEWGRHGIRVNAVAAGAVRTPKNAGETSDDDREAGTVIPLGRRGTPDDIAGAVVFLCSDLAGFVTGHTLVVDGGSSARPSYLDEANLPVFVQDPALRRRLRGATARE
jgi:NAD(P)-dependent dehydrogenase (short-subunit alcohol dehydrogenase family)